MDRKEHMKWCKDRALTYVEANDVNNAWASMVSDLGKHEETKDHIMINMGMAMFMAGMLSTSMEMRKFIEGFN